MRFCKNHRLPENHGCSFDLKLNSSLNGFNILYQDALDFMGKELTVAKIYDYVTTKQITKIEATNLLTYFIENSEDSEIRKISILAFKVLELKSETAFNSLESCIISEEDPKIRKIATEIITCLFPKKSKALLDWISKNRKP
ncbi:hypothetical protein LCGC14_2099900 [marine sediment metagenome]|uniref:HEAT repeat domain-containing protein n=1 Tax=marine sediment metagenome TaxID=412755 RepID=A0A0F9EAE5_9ZZZZ